MLMFKGTHPELFYEEISLMDLKWSSYIAEPLVNVVKFGFLQFCRT